MLQPRIRHTRPSPARISLRPGRRPLLLLHRVRRIRTAARLSSVFEPRIRLLKVLVTPSSEPAGHASISLKDAGYMLREGCMTPYRKTRYMLTQFQSIQLSELSRQENFNFIHSKLCNVIEWRFGVIKERWKILEKVPFMKRKKEAWVIISCFALDNYLWLRHYGFGSTYAPSSWWVELNETSTISELRELISGAVWGRQ